MGIGGISVWQLMIILLIVIVIFGSRRISQLGADLGGFVKGVKTALPDVKESVDEIKETADELKRGVGGPRGRE